MTDFTDTTITHEESKSPGLRPVRRGDYYRDISPSACDELYIVAKIDSEYVLIDVASGVPYSLSTVGRPSDVFCGDMKDFAFVETVNITTK